MANNVVTLRNVYGKEKAHCLLNPLKQSNGLNFPFVKRVRTVDPTTGETEMVLSNEEMNDPNNVYFIKEDEVIEIFDGKTFNLDDPREKNLWTCIEKSILIAPERGARDSKGNLLIDGGPTRYGQAEFYIERVGAESQKRVDRIRLVTKAYTFIDNDSPSGRQTKVRLLGKSMRNAPDSDVHDYLCTRAEKDPNLIIDLYTGTDTALKLLMIDARDKRIITSENGVYMYGDNVLGTTDDSVILFLKNPANKVIFDGIRNETYPEMVVAPVKPTKADKTSK